MPNHESEKQYSDTLNSILDAHSKFKYMCAEFDRVAMDLQKRLDDKEAKVMKWVQKEVDEFLNTDVNTFPKDPIDIESYFEQHYQVY